MNQKEVIKIMKIILVILILAMASSTVAAGKEPAQPITAETVQILKISPQDERAVIRTPDGKTQIIKPGDTFGTSGKVVEITADRVVIEEKKGDETEKIIIRLENGKQRVERIKKTAEKQPQLYAAPKIKEEKDKDKLQSQGKKEKKRKSVIN